MVDNCDILIAAWGGRPGAGPGGTASSIDYARHLGRHLFVIDPNGKSGVTEEQPRESGRGYLKRLAEIDRLSRIITTQHNSSALAGEPKRHESEFEQGIKSWLGRADHAAQRIGIWSRLTSDAIQ